MALGFSVRVYGNVKAEPPFVADVNGNLANANNFTGNQIQIVNFPTNDIALWPIQPGAKMAAGVFCYGVIEVPATGLNVHSTKFVVKETLATLATLRG